MAKGKQGFLEPIKKLIWGKEIVARDLTTARLDKDGSEVLDPIPHAITLGIRPQPSMEERVRNILNQDFFRKNPDYGLESDDDEDFGPEGNDPLYDFEKRHEALMARQRELEEAQAELDKEQERVDKEMKEKRAKAYLKKQAEKKEEAENPVIDVSPEPDKDGPKD